MAIVPSCLPSEAGYQADPTLLTDSYGPTKVEDIDDLDIPVSYNRIFREEACSSPLPRTSDSGKASKLSLESGALLQKSKGKMPPGATKRTPHQLSSVRKSQSSSKTAAGRFGTGRDLSRDSIVEGQEVPVEGSVHVKQRPLKPSLLKGPTPTSVGKHQSEPDAGRTSGPGRPSGASVDKTSRLGSIKRTPPSTSVKKTSPVSSRLSSKKKAPSVHKLGATPAGQAGKAPGLAKDQRTEHFLLLMDSIPEMPITENTELLELIAKDSGAKWSIFGRYLGVSDEDIEDIKETSYFDNERCAKVIVKWLENAELRPTYAKMACALVNTHQYGKVEDLKGLVPPSSYDNEDHFSMHVLKLPLNESSLASLVAEMGKEREGGRTGVEVAIRSVSSGDFPMEGLAFSLMSLGSGGDGLRVLAYVLKAAAMDGVGEVVVSLRYVVAA